MDIAWDTAKLLELLKDFHLFTKVRVGLFDSEGPEILAWPVEKSVFCTTLRQNAKCDQACLDCDKKAFGLAAHKTNPHIYRCHIGLTEMVVPINDTNGRLIANLVAGMIQPPPDQSADAWERISHRAGAYVTVDDELKKSYDVLPTLTPDETVACGFILQALATSVWADSYIRLSEKPVSAQAEAYIRANVEKRITVPLLTRRLGVCKTTLYYAIKDDFHKTITELINSVRIDKAKEYLRAKKFYIGQIAEKCGFTDLNYFSRVFKEETGVTPSEYRKTYTNFPAK